MSDESTRKKSSKTEDVFDFFYDRSPGYRAVHADGFVVSPNAKRAIAITFYSERLAIPKHVRLDFRDAEAEEVEEQIIDGKKGILRQMECTAFIDAETAEELRDWLSRAISAIDGTDEDDAQGGANV